MPEQELQRRLRIVARGDGFKVIPIGRSKNIFGDLYIKFIGGSWRSIILYSIGLFFLINIIFALLYYAIGDGISNSKDNSFLDDFFFSVQTFATIGYGVLAPTNLAANILVTFEAILGFAYSGVTTGVIFAKFARPTARILFSENAIITSHNGKPHFMFRLVNERGNSIVDANAKLTFMRDELTLEGKRIRRFYDLPLVRKEIPILRLTWSVLHEITENSPLYNQTHEDLNRDQVEIIISITGLDDTLYQTIHARNSYIADEIILNGEFEDMIERTDNYELIVRYDNLNKIIVK